MIYFLSLFFVSLFLAFFLFIFIVFSFFLFICLFFVILFAKFVYLFILFNIHSIIYLFICCVFVYINVTRHAKRDLLGSNVVTSEMTFKASQDLTSFSSNYFSRWLSSIGLYPIVTKLFGGKRTRPKTLVANKDKFVCFS